MEEQKNKKTGLIVVIVLMVIFLLLILLIYWWWMFGSSFRNSDAGNKSSQTIPESLVNQNNLSPDYQKLIGKWSTACLVPDPKSPWAEKHDFIFNADGSAQHWRWSGDSCATISRDQFAQKYQIEIPATGQINFISTEGLGNFYDIYKIEGTGLYFGHGFRDKYPPGMRKFGNSPDERFDSLNAFLKYQKS